MKPPGRTKRMLVICPFPVGVAPGQRLKYEQYFDDWRSLGWTIDVSPYVDLDTWAIVFRPGHFARKLWGLVKGHFRRLRDLARIGRYDLVYVHMWVTPLGTSIMERLVRRFARRLVLDIEDNVLVGQGLSRQDNPNYSLSLFKSPEKARYLIRTADHVISCSEILNSRYVELNERGASIYIPSSVDTDRFLPVNRYEGTAGLTIGWTGTHSTRVMLDLLRPVFQELARRRPFKLRVIGNFDYELPGVDLEVIRWSAEREVADLQAIDIGVYPLPADEWAYGKGGLKAIQYMAFGLPMVATDAGTTPLIVRDGENGLLVRTDEEWLRALELLMDRPDLRRRLGEQGRRDALAKYSVKSVAAKYRQVLSSLTS